MEMRQVLFLRPSISSFICDLLSGKVQSKKAYDNKRKMFVSILIYLNAIYLHMHGLKQSLFVFDCPELLH